MLIPFANIDEVFKSIVLNPDNMNRDEPNVLVLASEDVDSIAALKILISILNDEGVSFKIKPVSAYEDLANLHLTAEEQRDIKVVFLINCGGGINIVDTLNNLSKETYIWICDSHLPYEDSNIEDSDQVVIMDAMEHMKESDIPPGEGSFYGTSAARMMYELAFQLTKVVDDKNLLWMAIVGTTEQFIHRKITQKAYDEAIQNFFKDTVRNTEDISMQHSDHIVCVEQEFKFSHYRSWNIYESMFYSRYLASRLSVWTWQGKQNLEHLFVQMGLSLESVKKPWIFMNSEMKQALKTKLKPFAERVGLKDITFTSFVRSIEGKGEISAADTVTIISAILESGASGAFNAAAEAISGKRLDLLNEGRERAIALDKAIVKQAASVRENKLIIKNGAFAHVTLPQSAEQHLFTKPSAATALCTFFFDSLRARVKNPNSRMKPFVVCALNEAQGTCLIHGITAVPNERNQFGKLFQYAAAKTSSRVVRHHFDSSFIEVHKDDAKKLIEYAHSLAR